MSQPNLQQLLGDFSATAKHYNSVDKAIEKFPELRNYDKTLLGDYAATAIHYNSNDSAWVKFPEFHGGGGVANNPAFDLSQYMPPVAANTKPAYDFGQFLPKQQENTFENDPVTQSMRRREAAQQENLPTDERERLKEYLQNWQSAIGGYKPLDIPVPQVATFDRNYNAQRLQQERDNQSFVSLRTQEAEQHLSEKGIADLSDDELAFLEQKEIPSINKSEAEYKAGIQQQIDDIKNARQRTYKDAGIIENLEKMRDFGFEISKNEHPEFAKIQLEKHRRARLALDEQQNNLLNLIAAEQKISPATFRAYLKSRGQNINDYINAVRQGSSELNAIYEINMETREILNAPSKYEDTNGFYNWLKGAGASILKQLNDPFAIRNTFRNFGVKGLVEKMQAGEALTPSEEVIIAATFSNIAAKELRNDITAGYRAGQSAGDMITLMAELGLTSGASLAARKGIEKIISRMLGKQSEKMVASLFTRAVGSVARAAVDTALSPGLYNDISQTALSNRIEGKDYGFGDLGNDVYNRTKENWVERTGENLIDKVFERTGLGGFSRIWGRNPLFRAIGQNNPFTEVGGEYLGGAIDYVKSFLPFQSKETQEQLRGSLTELFTVDGFKVLMGSILPASAGFGFIGTVQNRRIAKQYTQNRAALENMLKQNDYGDNPRIFAEIVRDIENTQGSYYQSEGVQNILKTVLANYQRKFPNATQEQIESGVAKAGIVLADYLTSLNNYQRIIAESEKQMSDNQKKITAAQQEAIQFISPLVNEGNGNVIEAKLRNTDEPINITRGNILIGEDGTIDTDRSDKTFFYKGADGRLRIGKTEDLEGIISETPAEELIAQKIEKEKLKIENENAPDYEQREKVVVKSNEDVYVRGEIVGRNDDGTYQINFALPDGKITTQTIRPSEILANMQGTVDAPEVAVDYIDPQTKEERTGIMESRPENEQLFAGGYAVIDGVQVPFENIRGVHIDETLDNRQETQDVGSKTSENYAENAGIPSAEHNKLSDEQAEGLIAEMEAAAENAPVLELTPENWYAEFGENGMIETPIGEVKMGENQYLKMQAKNRAAEFGMVKPTLTNPDVILEETDNREGAERGSVLLFIKSFTINGEKVTHYESVTIQKDSKEIVVSNHIINKNALKNKISQSTILYNSHSNRSEMRLPENREGLSDIVPTQEQELRDKSTTNNLSAQEKAQFISDFEQALENNETPSMAEVMLYNEYKYGEQGALSEAKASHAAKYNQISEIDKKLAKTADSAKRIKLNNTKFALQNEIKEIDEWLKNSAAARAEQERQAAEAESRIQQRAERLEAGKQKAQMPEGAEVIQERWDSAPKIEGNRDVIVLPDGEKITGHWVMTEALASTPSHDIKNNFAQSEGYAQTSDGESLNTTDYKELSNQKQVFKVGGSLDRRAMGEIVYPKGEKRGATLSGNNRRIGKEYAIINGLYKNSEWVKYINDYGTNYGKDFTPENAAKFENVDIKFVPDNSIGEMTADLMKIFNTPETKLFNTAQNAKAQAKSLNSVTVSKIAEFLNDIDNLSEVYNSPEKTKEILSLLVSEGIKQTNELQQYINENGTMSGTGKDMFEALMLGAAFQGKAADIAQIMKFNETQKAVIFKAIPQIIENRTFATSPHLTPNPSPTGEGSKESGAGRSGYDITDYLSEALEIVSKANANGTRVEVEGRQLDLERGAHSDQAINLAMALAIDDRRETAKLRRIFEDYNNSVRDEARGVLSIEGAREPSAVLAEVLKLHGFGGVFTGESESKEQRAKNKDIPPRETLTNPNEITDEDFTNPSRDVVLPTLPENTLKIIGSEGKPVLVKKSIFEKNKNTHANLTPAESREILTNALYNPNLVGQSQPQSREFYYIMIKTGENRNATVVIDVYPKKDNIEVVGWRYIDQKGIEKLERQATREGGQILILAPENTGLAAALSALPSDLSSADKDTANNLNDNEKAEKISESEFTGLEDKQESKQIPKFLSEKEYINKGINKYVKENNLNLNEFEETDEYIDLSNEILDTYTQYILDLKESGELQKMFDAANIADDIKIRTGINDAGFEFDDFINSEQKKQKQKEERNKKKEKTAYQKLVESGDIKFKNNDNKVLNESQQKEVGEKMQEYDKRIADKAAELEGAKSEYNAAVKQHSKRNGLFGDTKVETAPSMFEVETDFSQENYERIVTPLLQRVKKVQDELQALKDGRAGFEQEVIKGVSNQGEIRFAIRDNKDSKEFNDNKELEAIKEAAIQNGTFMKAPNGKPTKLNERQWLQVRTAAFKKWFGDWENLENYKILFENAVVKSISGTEFQLDPVSIISEVAQYYKENYNNEVERAGFGTVELDERGVRDSAHHKGLNQFRKAAFAAVPEVIKNGILINEATNHKGRGYDTFTFAGPIEVGGKRNIAFVTVTRKGESNRFYLHGVVLQKKLQDGFQTDLIGTPLGDVAKVLQNFYTAKQNEQNISKATDFNGEPLVFMHQTDSELFTEFDREKTGANDLLYLDGFYFATDLEKGDYGKNEMQVFLNIRNPLDTHGNLNIYKDLGKFYDVASEEDIKQADNLVTAYFQAKSERNKWEQWNNETQSTDIIDEKKYAAAHKKIIDLSKEITKYAEKYGFDGVYDMPSKTTYENGKEVPNTETEYNKIRTAVVFNSEQIKSATDNTGAFDENNPDIRFQVGGLFVDTARDAAAAKKAQIEKEIANLKQAIAAAEADRKRVSNEILQAVDGNMVAFAARVKDNLTIQNYNRAIKASQKQLAQLQAGKGNAIQKAAEDFEKWEKAQQSLFHNKDNKDSKDVNEITVKQFRKLIARLKKAFPNVNINLFDGNEPSKEVIDVLGKAGVKAFAETAELARVNDKWNRDLQDFKDNKLKPHEVLSLGKPLDILQAAGLKNRQITITLNVLEKHLEKHNITIDDIQNLAEAIQTPIMVYEWGTKAKATIIITELTTKDGRKITVAVRAENKNNNLEVSEVSSIHGKATERFLSDMQNAKEGGLQDALRYVDKEKALNWFGLSTPIPNKMLSESNLLDVEVPLTSMQANQKLSANSKIGTAKVIQNFVNPTIEEKNFEFNEKYRLMRTNAGEVYGFTDGTNIYIDQNLLNANTPIHEFGHIWLDFIKKANPELWKKGVELVKGTVYFQRILESKAYDYLREGKREGVKARTVETQKTVERAKRVSEFITDVLDGKIKDGKETFEIPETAQKLAEQVLGHPIKSHRIKAEEIRHAWNNHGIGGSKINENSIPLRKEDFALIPYIMSSPDRVTKGNPKNNKESVKYYKDLSNGYVVVVEREVSPDNSNMENITMWAEKNRSDNATSDNLKGSSVGTSETHISQNDTAKVIKDFESAIEKDEIKFAYGKFYNEINADAISEMLEYDGGLSNIEAHYFFVEVENLFGSPIEAASRGAKYALESGLIPFASKNKYEGENEEYHHFRLENGDVISLPFKAGENYSYQIKDNLKETKDNKKFKDLNELPADVVEKIADEALATMIGDKGEALIQGVKSGDVSLTMFAKVKAWLNEVWNFIKQHAGIRNMNVNQIQDLTLDEFVNGAVADLLAGEEVSESGLTGLKDKQDLEKVNKKFNADLETLTAENADSKTFYLGNPSEILQSAGIENKELKLYGSKLLKKQKKHGFNFSDLKDLPKAVQNPIAIFKGNIEGSHAILTELAINGKNVLVTLNIGKGADIDFNIVTSTYGKSSDGIVGWINNGKLLYTDKEKALNYLHLAAPIAAASNKKGLSEALNYLSALGQTSATNKTGLSEINNDIDNATKVIQDFENPKFYDKNLLEKIKSDIAAAEADTDTEPSEAQKKAGNYRKGHVRVQGFDISIEQPKGSVRRGVSPPTPEGGAGKAWAIKMNNTYGYFGNTESKDGDHIDVFLGDNPLSDKVFVIDQTSPNLTPNPSPNGEGSKERVERGAFDEHKVMFGFDSLDEARAAYLSNYEKGWQGLGYITETDVETFRKWATKDGARKKAFAEYKQFNVNTDENLDNSEKGSTFAENNFVKDGKATQIQQRGGNGILAKHAADELRSRIGAAEAEQPRLTLNDKFSLEKWETLNYAKENGLWINDLYDLGQPFEGGGVESTLAYNADENAIYKANNLILYSGGRNNQTPVLNLLQAIETHNTLFPETAYELVGFTGVDTSNLTPNPSPNREGNKRTPYIEVVLRQNYVPNATQATEQEIADFMQYRGFKPTNEKHEYEKDGVVVSDLRPRNVLKGADGSMHVVDNNIKYKPQYSAKGEMREGAKEEKAAENLDNSEKRSTFAGQKNNVEYDSRTETDSALRELVGTPEARRGIYRTVEASNNGGNVSAILDVEELEELESRGINPFWDKKKFQNELRNQAQANGVWLDNSYLDDKELLHNQKARGTSEHDVYRNPDGKTLTKLNNLAYVTSGEHAHNLAAVIDRFAAHNELFPNVAYTIKGFMDNQHGNPALVLEQPYIDAERNATREEIHKFLTEHGFKLDGVRGYANLHEVWSNGKYEIFDARPANVLKGRDGELYFFDTVPHSIEYLTGLKQPEFTPEKSIFDYAKEEKEYGEESKIRLMAKTEFDSNADITAPNIKEGAEDKRNVMAGNTSVTNSINPQPRLTDYATFNDWQRAMAQWRRSQSDPNNPANKMPNYSGKSNIPISARTVDNNPRPIFSEFKKADGSNDVDFYKQSVNAYNLLQKQKEEDKLTVSQGLPKMPRQHEAGHETETVKEYYDRILQYNEEMKARREGRASETVTPLADIPDPISAAKIMNEERYNEAEAVAEAVIRKITFPNPNNEDTDRYELNEKLRRGTYRFLVNWADMHLPVKSFIETLEKKGVKVSGIDNWWKRVTMLPGIEDKALKNYNRDFQKPLNDIIEKIMQGGVTLRELENYVMLKHGVERNRWMSEHRPGVSREDYSGIYAIAAEIYAQQKGIDFIKNPILYRQKDSNREKLDKIMKSDEFKAVRDKIVADTIAEFEKKVNGMDKFMAAGKKARIEKLRNSKPIKITGKEITPSEDLKEYKANALEYGKNFRGEYVNKDTGVSVFIGKNGIKEVLHHDYKNKEQLQSIAAIPQIIKNSIYIDSKQNTDTKVDAEKFDYYVSGLKIGGVDYTVRSVFVTLKDGTRYYDHKLTQIEKIKLLDSLIATNHGFNQAVINVDLAGRVTNPAQNQSISERKDSVLFDILQINDDNFENISELWSKINAATNFAIDTSYKFGMIGKKEYDETKERYKYYVPLRGHEYEAEKDFTYVRSGTFFTQPLNVAHGRTTRAEHPFAYIIQLANTAIREGNRNELNQSLLRLGRKDTKGLIQVNKTFYKKAGTFDKNGNEEWEEVKPPFALDKAFDPKMYQTWLKEQYAAAHRGEVREGGLDMQGLFIKPSQTYDHAVPVWENGIQYQVFINASPAVAQAINGENRDIPKTWAQVLRRAQAWLAMNLTSRNPLFTAKNFSRDTIMAAAMSLIKENPAYTARYFKNIPIAAAILTKEAVTGKENQYLKEFLENGGETGWTSVFEVQKQQKRLERELKDVNASLAKKIAVSPRVLLDFLDTANNIAENTTRLAIYMTSRERGKTIIDSVSDAKEITLNFNRKGAGGMLANEARTLYLFVNAGIQALNNILSTGKKFPKKTVGMMVSFAAMGYLQAMLMGDDDDDDYWKIPEYQRNQNFIIPLWKGNFLQFPIAQEFRVFNMIGSTLYAMQHGKKDTGDGFLAMLGGLADLIPINPLDMQDAGWAALVPNIAQPFVQLESNKTFTGSMIYNTREYEGEKKYKPGWQQVRTNKRGEPYVPQTMIGLLKSLDLATGGDGVKPGLISGNPDKVNHILRSYFGGFYTLAQESIDIAMGIIDKAQGGSYDVKTRNTPFINTFFIDNADLQERNSELNGQYYDALKKSEEQLSYYHRYLKDFDKEYSKFEESKKKYINGEITLQQYAKDSIAYNEAEKIFNKKIEPLHFEENEQIRLLKNEINYNEKYLKDETLSEEEKQEIEREVLELKSEVIGIEN